MSNQLSSSFISVVSFVDSDRLKVIELLPVLERELRSLYSDYEIILVAKKNVEKPITCQMKKILEATPAIRWIQLSNNAPEEVLLAAGLESAIGDFVVLMDLKTDPIELIKNAVDKCKSGVDVIVGTAKGTASFGYSLLRPIASYLLKKIDYRLPKDSTLFRCLSRRATNAVISSGKFHYQLLMQIQKTEYEFADLPYQFKQDKPKRLYAGIREMMRLIVFNSMAPLRLMSFVGLAGSGIACLFSIYAIILRLLRNDIVEGWASTVFLISIFSFLQFMILAFISEYLGRLLYEQRHLEAYSVVFEKNSLTMVNQDRINVLEVSINESDQNLVQTGRNR